MGQATSFAVWIGDLREVVANKRGLLKVFTDMANLRPEAPPHYGERMIALAARVVRLEELAELLEAAIACELQVRAVIARTPIARFPDYRPAGLADQILDGRAVLVRASVDKDMGPELQVAIAGRETGRYVHVARSEIVGVGCG